MHLLQAEPAVGGIGDARHRGQHHRGVDPDRAEGQTGAQDFFFFLLLAVGAGEAAADATAPVQRMGATACNGR